MFKYNVKCKGKQTKKNYLRSYLRLKRAHVKTRARANNANKSFFLVKQTRKL